MWGMRYGEMLERVVIELNSRFDDEDPIYDIEPFEIAEKLPFISEDTAEIILFTAKELELEFGTEIAISILNRITFCDCRYFDDALYEIDQFSAEYRIVPEQKQNRRVKASCC